MVCGQDMMRGLDVLQCRFGVGHYVVKICNVCSSYIRGRSVVKIWSGQAVELYMGQIQHGQDLVGQSHKVVDIRCGQVFMRLNQNSIVSHLCCQTSDWSNIYVVKLDWYGQAFMCSNFRMVKHLCAQISGWSSIYVLKFQDNKTMVIITEVNIYQRP